MHSLAADGAPLTLDELACHQLFADGLALPSPAPSPSPSHGAAAALARCEAAIADVARAGKENIAR